MTNNCKMIEPYIFECYELPLNFTEEGYIICLWSYNPDFFTERKALMSYKEKFLTDFMRYSQEKKRRSNLIEFLIDSVKNNTYLNDSFTQMDFILNDDHILFEFDGIKKDWKNMGVFSIEKIKVVCSASYTFIEDMQTNKKYIYYED